MSGICVANEEIILPKNVTNQELCDRRKRKSCDNDDFELDGFKPDSSESKRSRLEPVTDSTDEASSSPIQSQPLPETVTSGATSGAEPGPSLADPSSEDCSSTSGTSGIDVAEKSPEPPTQNAAGPSETCQKLLSEVKLLTEFETFLPNLVHEKLRSALRKPVRKLNPEKSEKPDDICPKSPKQSKSVRFDVVREFRFARTQSFVTMPSYGGCSLGMEQRHMSGRELGLDRYRIERERSKRRKYRRWRKKQQVDVVTNSSSESDSDEEDDLNVEAFMGLLPVPPDRRKRLLMRSGSEILDDNLQQNANQLVRTSRESCGCSCEGICYPETCECYINDIGCQVDRLSFPCGCIKERCFNPNGRTSFNVERVKNHFYRTMHRIHQQRQSGVSMPVSAPDPSLDQKTQKFSFGDFTVPQGDPPVRNEYQMSMGMSTWMNNMNNMYNWNENCYMDRYDPWNTQHLNLPHLGINNGVSVEYPVNVSNAELNGSHTGSRTAQSSYQFQDSNTVHISCVPTVRSDCSSVRNQSRICSLQTIEQQNENERLSESSESGIGDENTLDTPNNTATGANFQTCGGLETSITIAYNDDSNNSVPLSVGSE